MEGQARFLPPFLNREGSFATFTARCRTIPRRSMSRAPRSTPEGTLHVAIGLAPKARGRLAGLGLDKVRAAPGAVAVPTPGHIPGRNDVSPAFGDEPLFAAGKVSFRGQALFAVVAQSHEAARRAARLALVEIEAEHPSVTVEDALARG